MQPVLLLKLVERALGELVKRLSSVAHPVALLVWPIGAEAQEGCLIALACGPDDAWVLSLDRAQLQTREGRELARWLADPAAEKISHDAKMAMRRLARSGCPLDGVGVHLHPVRPGGDCLRLI